MKYIVHLLFLFLILLSVWVAFKPEIIEFASEVYYFVNERSQKVEQVSYEDVFSSSRYWRDDDFLIDNFAKDLGYIPAVKQFEPEMISGKRPYMWRCGHRRFSIGLNGDTIIGIIGDEWDDLSTVTVFVDDGFDVVLGDDVILENVDEETMTYIISEMFRLREGQDLRSVTENIRDDIEKYHADQGVPFRSALVFYTVAVRFLMSL